VTKALGVEEILALPAAVDLVTAGKALGIGRTKIHELARRDELPFPVLRLGAAYRVRRADLIECLGLDAGGT
jgi:hypothetical protein